MFKMLKPSLAITLLVAPCHAGAQTLGGVGLGSLEAGYGNGRAMEAERFNPSTRDSQGNRIIKDGIIQSGTGGSLTTTNTGSALYGAAFFESGAGNSATAIGNLVNVTVEGSNNTIVLNSVQTNTGSVKATAVLNGSTSTATGSGH